MLLVYLNIDYYIINHFSVKENTGIIILNLITETVFNYKLHSAGG